MSDDPETTRGEHGRWRGGQSGNPKGRPIGSRHRALIALDAIGAEGAERVLRRVMAMAEGGDVRAAEVVLSRLWPARKGRPVHLDLPDMQTPADLAAALGAVAGAVGRGDVTPDEGSAVAAVLEAKRRAIETAQLEERLAALEAALPKNGAGQ